MELTADEILDRALTLPDEQRGRIAALLMDSLDGEDQSEVEAAWAAEVKRRVEELKSGTVETLTLEAVEDRLARRGDQ